MHFWDTYLNVGDLAVTFFQSNTFLFVCDQ